MERRSRFLHLCFVVALGSVLYLNSLNVPFYLDDYPSIVENPDIRNIGYFVRSFGKTPFQHGSRFLTYLTFSINYAINGLDVTGYHIVNITIHLINAILVYYLAFLLLKTGGLVKERLPDSGNSKLPLLTALLFVAHPIQTQAVTYIVQRLTIMATMFYLSSIVFYLYWRTTGKKVYFSIALFSAICSMFTKEISFTLPVMLLAVEIIFYKDNITSKLKRLVPFFITMPIIPIILYTAGKTAGTTLLPRADSGLYSRVEYLYTQFSVLLTYLRLVFVPINQNLLYDYPIYSSPFTLKVIIGALIHLILIAVATVFLIRSKKPEIKIAGFGIIWFYISLSVESSIIPIRDVIFEHRLYLPSIGILLSIVSMGFLLLSSKRVKGRYLKTVIPLVVLILLSVTTFTRNNLWSNKLNMWIDVVTKSPRNPKALNSLASLLIDLNQPDRAEYFLERAIKIRPDFPKAYYNLGYVYIKKGDLAKAEGYFLKALQLDPAFYKAYNNLGVIYLKKDMPQKALEYFNKALNIRPKEPKTLYNIANAYLKLNDHHRAIDFLKRAIALKPDYIYAYNNLATIYLMDKQYDKAIYYYKKAIEIAPEYGLPYYNLYRLYRENGKDVEAKYYYSKAKKYLRNIPPF